MFFTTTVYEIVWPGLTFALLGIEVLLTERVGPIVSVACAGAGILNIHAHHHRTRAIQRRQAGFQV